MEFNFLSKTNSWGFNSGSLGDLSNEYEKCMLGFYVKFALLKGIRMLLRCLISLLLFHYAPCNYS